MRRSSLVGVVVGLTLITSVDGTPSTATDNGSIGSAVWVAASDSVLTLSRDSGAILREIPVKPPVRALAVDLPRERVWVLAGMTLYRYGFDGVKQAAYASTLSSSEHAHAAVVETDGSVWIGVRHELRRFTDTGVVAVRLRLRRHLEGLAYAPDVGRLWIATEQTVTELDPVTGSVRGHLPLPTHYDVEHLALGPQGDVWIASEHDVRRYDAAGALAVTLPRHDVDALGAPSGGEGGAWIASDDRLERVSRAGARLWSNIRPLEHEKIERIQVFPSGDAWVGGDEQLARVDRSGHVQARISFRPPIHVHDLDWPADAIADARLPRPSSERVPRKPRAPEPAVRCRHWGFGDRHVEPLLYARWCTRGHVLHVRDGGGVVRRAGGRRRCARPLGDRARPRRKRRFASDGRFPDRHGCADHHPHLAFPAVVRHQPARPHDRRDAERGCDGARRRTACPRH